MSERKEIEAFFNFFATFNLARPVSTIQDLADGAALFEVLSLVYVVRPNYQVCPPNPTLAMQATFDSQPDPRPNRQRIGFSDLVPLNVSIVS